MKRRPYQRRFPHHWPWLTALLAVWVCVSGCTRKPQVVVYCAQDQVYAEPIFAAFTKATGIEVRAVFDNEAVKSVGLANRILAEREHPVADVFWGNEEFQTRRLAAAGVFRESNGWTTCGHRSRRLVTGTAHRELAGRGLLALTNTELRGRVSIAAPWFGSTATHFAALRAEWGEQSWRDWCRGLASNRVFLEEGNSHVVKRVARGEAWVGLTDSDDIESGNREGLGLVAGPALFSLRNTVGILRGAPRPETAEQLSQYLQSPAVQEKLVLAGAIEAGPIGSASAAEPRWDAMIRDFEATGRELREAFAQ